MRRWRSGTVTHHIAGRRTTGPSGVSRNTFAVNGYADGLGMGGAQVETAMNMVRRLGG
ncbi:hypothetical protein GCM10010399_05180 [Dactylosporangium fulvum]